MVGRLDHLADQQQLPLHRGHGLSQHDVSEALARRPTGDEVNMSAEDLAELVGDTFDPPAESRTGAELAVHVYIGVPALLPTAHRTEGLPPRNAIAATDLAHAFEVRGKPRYSRGEIPRQQRPAASPPDPRSRSRYETPHRKTTVNGGH